MFSDLLWSILKLTFILRRSVKMPCDIIDHDREWPPTSEDFTEDFFVDVSYFNSWLHEIAKAPLRLVNWNADGATIRSEGCLRYAATVNE